MKQLSRDGGKGEIKGKWWVTWSTVWWARDGWRWHWSHTGNRELTNAGGNVLIQTSRENSVCSSGSPSWQVQHLPPLSIYNDWAPRGRDVTAQDIFKRRFNKAFSVLCANRGEAWKMKTSCLISALNTQAPVLHLFHSWLGLKLRQDYRTTGADLGTWRVHSC